MGYLDKVRGEAKRVVQYQENAPETISTREWVTESNVVQHPGRSIVDYVVSIFPIFQWITKYNFGWFTGDLISGLTVGMVLVPQSMSYAQIATLSPEYGLYSSFIGVLLYCLFGTSKDIQIGPVAVMSLTVSQIIAFINNSHHNQWSGPEIAITLSVMCGSIVLGIGVLRLGWLVEFIPLVAVSGFMTGSAINIAAGQVPGLMGITGFNTRAATYEVIINTLKYLPKTKMDAAFGIPALFFLYGIRMSCDYLSKRYPRRRRVFFFISVFRNAFVVLILTIAAWLYTRHHRSAKGTYPIKILQTVPRGFQHLGVPHIDKSLLTALAPKLPVATIILLLEHIAIAKSFGRINGYTINPNQELIAIGVANTVGSFFSAYPATGSFSRSALNAKSGARTPAAGVYTSLVVLVALYGLTPAFYWIPTAALSAVIIHAVANLVASPAQVYSFWKVSPLEFIIFWAALLTTIFATIEDGIYVALCMSVALALVRIARPRGKFLGTVSIRQPGTAPSEKAEERSVFVPLNDRYSTSHLEVIPPAPGIIIYRHEESYIYPNSHIFNTNLVQYVKANTKKGKDTSQLKLSDRPWNDAGTSRNQLSEEDKERQAVRNHLPPLHAIVLDFSSVSQIDLTAVQTLVDARDEIERYADHPVEFHFATILSPWIYRALVAGGFGTGQSSIAHKHELAAVSPNRHSLSILASNSDSSSRDEDKKSDPEIGIQEQERYSKLTSVVPEETPFFHIDLMSAVRAAERSLAVGTDEGAQ